MKQIKRNLDDVNSESRFDKVIPTSAQDAGELQMHNTGYKYLAVGFDTAKGQTPMFGMDPDMAVGVGSYLVKRGLRAVINNGFVRGAGKLHK
ncbi:MAG: hypothetical protein IJ899_03015 [Blautia sp.]|nr:hypothetical protein [Blautia sp.]